MKKSRIIEVECEVLSVTCTLKGEAFVRARQLMVVSWHYGEDASLDGCPLVPVAPWQDQSSPYEERFDGAKLTYGFHLLRPSDIDRFSPGLRVVFRPGSRIPDPARPSC